MENSLMDILNQPIHWWNYEKISIKCINKVVDMSDEDELNDNINILSEVLWKTMFNVYPEHLRERDAWDKQFTKWVNSIPRPHIAESNNSEIRKESDKTKGVKEEC